MLSREPARCPISISRERRFRLFLIGDKPCKIVANFVKQSECWRCAGGAFAVSLSRTLCSGRWPAGASSHSVSASRPAVPVTRWHAAWLKKIGGTSYSRIWAWKNKPGAGGRIALESLRGSVGDGSVIVPSAQCLGLLHLPIIYSKLPIRQRTSRADF